MRNLIISFLFASSCLISATSAGAVGPVPPLPPDFPFDDIASQMAQFDINNFVNVLGSEYVLNREKLIDYFDRKQIGSLFNTPLIAFAKKPIPNIDEWRAMMEELYEISSTRGNKIPVLFGLDSVHGANYVYNATLFPQQIGIAATFNTSVAKEGGRITAQETRYAGVPWLFAPILDIAVQPSWARVYETFGEDTVVVSEMGVATVQGIQSPPSKEMNQSTWRHQAAACIKHFLAYPDSRTGHDRTPAYIPMNIILQYFAPPFVRAIQAGAMSVMENYIEVNGRPTASSDMMLNFLLREMFGFKGMLVSDYNEIFNLADFHYTSENYTEAIFDSFNTTSMDMGMVGLEGIYPSMASTILSHVERGRIPKERVRQSGARLMELKKQLGLFEGSPVPKQNTSCMFACDSHRAASLDAARQSIVLLRNNPIPSNAWKDNSDAPLLPVDPSKPYKIAVVGKACDSLSLMNGGWTVSWQGLDDASGGIAYGSTIKEEIQRRFSNSATTVTYSQGCNVTEDSVCGDDYLAESVQNAANADFVVACVGETHYAEKPGDIEDITLPGQQIDWFTRLYNANKNIIMVLVEGRPRVLKTIGDLAPAVLHAFLPGPAGGEAIVDILTGLVNPSGRLPITYPRTVNNAPIQYNRRMSANTGKDYTPQWAFGTGLSYTKFVVQSVNCESMPPIGWRCTATIKNNGTIDGAFAGILYARQHYRPIAPEAQRVVGFKKVFIRANETEEIEVWVTLSLVSFYDEYNCEQGTSAPITFSMFNNENDVTSVTVAGYPFRQTMCTNWVGIWQQNTGFNYIVPTAAPTSEKGAVTEAYFISSVVCFGAGIVGTVILITWLRKRGNQKAGSLLEPSAI